MIRPAEVVRHRLAGFNADEEISFVVQEAARQFDLDQAGELRENQDYWLAAWLAAACASSLDIHETTWLTRCMAESGHRIDAQRLPHPVVDKHSTGGVGDKTTLILLPILAACGLTCLKMSGKGLGHTGGTIDKLASVPGFQTEMTPDQMVDTALACGIALAQQGKDLAPADGKLYQLRDLTGTVASVPLIVGSILSKKIAGGADLIGLDVKCGSGALMVDEREAVQLATWLVDVGRAAGLDIHAAVTDMDQPLGRMVGNALEVKEAAQVLRGEGDSRLTELCLQLAGDTLEAAGIARDAAKRALASGSAHRKAAEWFQAQGGNPRCLEMDEWEQAPHQTTIVSTAEGFVQKVDARAVGESAVELGAGRARKNDAIDPAVGVEVLVQPRQEISVGQELIIVHHRSDLSDTTVNQLRDAVRVGQVSPSTRPLIITRI
jgi:pyrimidine-nucleoside phosphorylase